MCGIVGAYTFGGFEKKSEEKLRTEASIFITTQLLQMTVDRGKDATGISMIWADGNYAGLKMGVPAPDFIARFGDKETDYKGMMKMWREYPKLCRVFMGHCRKSSVGNSYDNKNNHPLQVGDMVFLHNGTLKNDDIIFEKLKAKRIAEVDSEAIGHLLNHFTQNGAEPFTKEVIDETTRRLEGTYSVIAANGNNPFQVAQFRNGRPAEFVYVKPLQTVFVASEKKYLQNVLYEYNKFTQLFSSLDLPYLKKEDVEFKTMTDDSYVIWDLTTQITKDTAIDDLYDWGKIPGYADRIWKDSTTTTTGNYNSNWNSTSKKTVAATSAGSNKTNSGSAGTSGKTTKTSTDTGASANGVLWSKRLNKYKTQTGIKKSSATGAVEVNIDSGEITVLEQQSGEDDGGLDEVSRDRIETLMTGAASVKEVAAARSKDAVEQIKKPGVSSDEELEESNIVEVDMSVASPQAVKAAADFCKNLQKFTDTDSVVEALDLDDASVLEALPVHALANRIMKFAVGFGFAAGYDTRRVKPFTKQADNDTDPTGLKLANATRKMQTMKTIVSILGYSLKDHMPKEEMLDTFLDGICEYIRPGALKRVKMEDAFSVGDLKNIPMLDKLKDVIDEESEKEK